MPIEKLPPEHHVIRYVSWAKLRKADDDPEKVVGVTGEAFKMRDADDYLSVTSVEYFPGDRQQQIHGAVHAIRASTLEVKKRSGFAVGNVGAIKTECASKKHSIRVLLEPEDDNKAHVAIRRFPREDMELFELLAAGVWSELVLNGDVADGATPAPDSPSWEQGAEEGKEIKNPPNEKGS